LLSTYGQNIGLLSILINIRQFDCQKKKSLSQDRIYGDGDVNARMMIGLTSIRNCTN